MLINLMIDSNFQKNDDKELTFKEVSVMVERIEWIEDIEPEEIVKDSKDINSLWSLIHMQSGEQLVCSSSRETIKHRLNTDPRFKTIEEESGRCHL